MDYDMCWLAASIGCFGLNVNAFWPCITLKHKHVYLSPVCLRGSRLPRHGQECAGAGRESDIDGGLLGGKSSHVLSLLIFAAGLLL